jgi:hypothetical protein
MCCHSERSEESPHWPLFVFVRHSGAASCVVILSAAATEIVILAQPPRVVILSAAKNPRIGLCFCSSF